MNTLKRIFIALSGLLLTVSVYAAPDDAGLLLSVKGKVEVISATGSTPALPFKYVKRGDRIHVDEGGQLTLTFYAKKALFYLVGPSEVEMGASDVITRSGTAPTVKSMQEGQVRAASITQDQVRRSGAMNLRGLATMVELQQPEPWSMVLSEHPAFAWSSELPAPYDVVIVDAQSNQEVAHATTNDLKWSMDKAGLKSGASYTWHVSSGTVSSPTRVFIVASDKDRNEIEAARPHADDGKETWLLFVAALKVKRLDEEVKTALNFINNKWPETAP